jgi:hypothetical protein
MSTLTFPGTSIRLIYTMTPKLWSCAMIQFYCNLYADLQPYSANAGAW